MTFIRIFVAFTEKAKKLRIPSLGLTEQPKLHAECTLAISKKISSDNFSLAQLQGPSQTLTKLGGKSHLVCYKGVSLRFKCRSCCIWFRQKEVFLKDNKDHSSRELIITYNALEEFCSRWLNENQNSGWSVFLNFVLNYFAAVILVCYSIFWKGKTRIKLNEKTGSWKGKFRSVAL